MTNIITPLVHGLVFNNAGQFLILKRAKQDKTSANVWELPGGALKDNESVIDGLIRTVQDSCGLAVEIKNKQPIYSSSAEEDVQEFRDIVFVAKRIANDISPDTAVRDESAWVTFYELANYDLADYLSECVRQIFEE
ncbi:MAG: NUDIX hydrolase [Patescibacteria group bacterium]|jgi:ADP-ribose pyrophosphatase YjhB (NUDIX family)